MYISHKDTNSKYIIKINTISLYFIYMRDSSITTYMYIHIYTYIHVYPYTPTYTDTYIYIYTS